MTRFSATATAAERTHQPDRVLIQRNPTSGSGRGTRELFTLIDELRRRQFRVRLFASRKRLDSFLEQPGIRETVRCLVAAGGDGTIASLINRHSDLPIAILPLGTENLVARYLKIPRCGRAVADMIDQQHCRTCDTGWIDGQRFLVMASCGVDAEVVHRLSRTRSGHISRLSYAGPILKSFFQYHYPAISVLGPQDELLGTGSHVIVTNIPEYGFRFPFCPDADPSDGKLDVRIFRGRGTCRTAWHAIKTRLGWETPSEIQRFCATHITLRSEDLSAPCQADGDPAGIGAVTIRIEPSSMKILCPPALPGSQ